jgi:MFS family permease
MVAGSLFILLSAGIFLDGRGGAAGLIVGSVVLGTGHLLTVIGQQATVANTAGPGTFDSAFGYYTFAASLGQAIGPVLISVSGGDRTIPDTGTIFLVATVLGVVLVLSTLVVPVPPPQSREARAAAGGMGTLLRLPGLPRALLVSSVVLAAIDITLVYLPALGAERGLPAALVGALLTLRAAASMTSRFFLGRLVRLVGRRRLLLTSVALSAVTMAAVAVPAPGWVLGLLVVLMGLGLGLGQPMTMTWIAELTPRGLRGRAMSLRLTGNRLGQSLLPTTVGLVAAGAGAAGVLVTTAVALALTGAAARKLAVDGSGGTPPG